VLSWGRGASGQLGHGEMVPNCLYPKLVDSLASSRISRVSAGWNHSGFVSGFWSLNSSSSSSSSFFFYKKYEKYNLGNPSCKGISQIMLIEDTK